jgi:hypothetical protein
METLKGIVIIFLLILIISSVVMATFWFGRSLGESVQKKEIRDSLEIELIKKQLNPRE